MFRPLKLKLSGLQVLHAAYVYYLLKVTPCVSASLLTDDLPLGCRAGSQGSCHTCTLTRMRVWLRMSHLLHARLRMRTYSHARDTAHVTLTRMRVIMCTCTCYMCSDVLSGCWRHLGLRMD